MLSNTHYTVSVDLLQDAISQLPIFDQRLDLTVSTGEVELAHKTEPDCQ
jgi:hypothetical protein